MILVENDLEEGIYEENDQFSDEEDGEDNKSTNLDGYHCH